MYKMEVWKDIPGHEGYQASSKGNIRSFKRSEPMVLTPSDNGTGYFAVKIQMKPKPKRLYIHRLVAITFYPDADFTQEVNHKNGVKSDNSIYNLEWLSRQDNHKHGREMGLIKSVLTPQALEAGIKARGLALLDLQTGIYYDTLAEAARAKGYLAYNLRNWVTGKIKNKSSLIAV